MLDEKQILTCAGEDGHFQPAKLTRHKLSVENSPIFRQESPWERCDDPWGAF
jgi:hypothetical protein